MLLVVISFVFLPLVLGVVDPTKVCAPDQVSFYSYDIMNDIYSFVVVDFKQRILSAEIGNTTVVNDLNAAKSYATDDQGHCTSSDLIDTHMYPQCLPAAAVPVGDISVGIGRDQLTATGWQFPSADGNVKVAFTDQSNEPNFPILYRHSDVKGIIEASFYFDVVANITKPDLLVIPSPCPPKVIV